MEDRRDVDGGMAGVEVGEELLVLRLELVVELFEETIAQLGHQRLVVETGEELAETGEDQPGVVEVGRHRFGHSRVLDLDRHGVARTGHGPVDLADGRRRDGPRVPLGEDHLRWRPQLLLDHGRGELGAHGRSVVLELGEGVANVLRQPLVEVAGHLPDLHQGALHLAEHLGHLLGRPHLEGRVELAATLGIGEHPPGPMGGVRAPGPSPQPGQAGGAGRLALVAHHAVHGSAHGDRGGQARGGPDSEEGDVATAAHGWRSYGPPRRRPHSAGEGSRIAGAERQDLS